MGFESVRRAGAPRRRAVAIALSLSALGLAASPGVAGILDATWTAPTTNVDGSALTDLAGYRVFYSSVLDPPCTGSTFAEVVSPTPSPAPDQQISVRLNGLTTDTTYHVAVTAVNASGAESTCSTTASAVAHSDFSVSPAGTVDFGSVAVGSSADRTFTLQNTAGGSVSGTVSVPAPFSVVGGNPFTLVGQNATQDVTVRFTPTGGTTATANLSFAADGDNRSRIVTGTGTVTDTTAPTISITTPTSSATYATSLALLTLGGTAADAVGVTQVTWANDRGGSGTATGTTSWTASGIALQAGTSVLTVVARDAAGNVGTATLTVTAADATPPSVTLTAPVAGTTVAGTVTVSAEVSVGVAGVQFRLDGIDLGTEVTSPPYALAWNTKSAANGSHALSAVARDAAGNTATSAPVDVTVSNGARGKKGPGKKPR